MASSALRQHGAARREDRQHVSREAGRKQRGEALPPHHRRGVVAASTGARSAGAAAADPWQSRQGGTHHPRSGPGPGRPRGPPRCCQPPPQPPPPRLLPRWRPPRPSRTATQPARPRGWMAIFRWRCARRLDGRVARAPACQPTSARQLLGRPSWLGPRAGGRAWQGSRQLMHGSLQL